MYTKFFSCEITHEHMKKNTLLIRTAKRKAHGAYYLKPFQIDGLLAKYKQS